MSTVPTGQPYARRDPAPGFGATLAAIRTRHNLSQTQLAERMDASHATVSRWESGERIPKRRAVDRIADALDLRGDDYDKLYLAAGLTTDRITRFVYREFFPRSAADD